MEIDFEKLNKDARELGIEVNENSDNPGMYYRDDDGELVKWDYESEFREVFGEENRRVDDMKYYKVAVFGSRDFDDYELLYDKLVIYFQGTDLTIGEVEIVEGGARGADNLAMRFAEEYNLKHTQFPADWDKNGKSAGHIRNSEMAKYCDFGVAFWDGESKGTRSMVEKLERLGKEVVVVHV